MVVDFSQLILGYGQKINIASDSIKSARLKLKQAHMELEETNAIERDTAKNKYLLCALIIVVLIVIFLIYRASRK
jgi:t-SNARE complex subunit (syntaxin)